MNPGSLAIDTSALVCRYLADRDHGFVTEAMAGDAPWCASAIVAPELDATLARAAPTRSAAARLERAAREDREAMYIVPLDDRCLARATELGAAFSIPTIDAIHLAAADRLPGPVGYLTLDRRQIPAASALGFEVISPTA